MTRLVSETTRNLHRHIVCESELVLARSGSGPPAYPSMIHGSSPWGFVTEDDVFPRGIVDDTVVWVV